MAEEEHPMNDDDPIAKARVELAALNKVLDALEPLSPRQRLITLASVAAKFGFYEQAHDALVSAEALDCAEKKGPPGSDG